MKNIKDKINNLRKNIDKVQDDKYKEIFNQFSNILDELNENIEEVMVNETVLAENFKYMNEDISGIQDELFEEVSIEDLEEMEEEYIEISCDNCGKTIYIEQSVLDKNEEVKCPYCNELIKNKK